MKITRISVALISLVLLGGSCKKNADVAPATCSQIDVRAQAFSDAVKAYSVSQTKANCEAFKKAGNDYISAAANCPGVSATDIASARNSINSTTCPQ